MGPRSRSLMARLAGVTAGPIGIRLPDAPPPYPSPLEGEGNPDR